MNLEYHLMIFDSFWMKKHRIIINMTSNILVFWLSYYIYIEVFLSIILNHTTLLINIIHIKTTKDFDHNKIMKRGFNKIIEDFHKISDKVFKSKRN